MEPQELLSTLHVIAGHLHDLDPAIAMEQLRRTKYVADLNNNDWESPLKICDDSEISRAASEVAEKLSAWTPIALASPDMQEGTCQAPVALMATCVHAQAAAATAEALLAFLPAQYEGPLSPQLSTMLFRLLSACGTVVLGPAASVLYCLQQLAQRSYWPWWLHRTVAKLLLESCSSVMSAACAVVRLLSAWSVDGTLSRPAQAALATTCKPATMHSFWATCVTAVDHCRDWLGCQARVPLDLGIATLCQLTVWLQIKQPLSIAAFGTWGDGNCSLLRADLANRGTLLPLVGQLHRQQVHALVAAPLVGTRQEGQPDEECWEATAGLLRVPAFWAGLPADTLLQPATVAVAAVQPLLRRYLSTDLSSDQDAVWLGISAAANLTEGLLEACCGSAQRAQGTGTGTGRDDTSPPSVAWEGLAACCSALQAVLEREILVASDSSAAGGAAANAAAGAAGAIAGAAAAEAAAGLARAALPGIAKAVQAVTDLLKLFGVPFNEESKSLVDPEDAAAATAGIEAAQRLLGRLWQGQGQLEAALGSVAASQLVAAAAMMTSVMALPLTLGCAVKPHLRQQHVQALGWLIASLVKLVWIAFGQLSTLQNLPDSGIPNGLHVDMLARIRFYLCRFLPLVARLDPNAEGTLSFLRWVDGLVLRAGYVCTAVLKQATRQNDPELTACAPDVVSILMLLEQARGLGRQAASMGLPPLVGQAVQQLTSVCWTEEAWESLAQVLQCLCSESLGWSRPPLCLLASGMLHRLVTWAGAAARFKKRGFRPAQEVQERQRQVVKVVKDVADSTLTAYWQHTGKRAVVASPAGIWDRQAVLERLSSPQRQLLNSVAFWGEVAALLQGLERIASQGLAAPAAEEQELQREAQALACFLCANPLCTNLSGCSESCLRHLARRCSGCRAVHYCSRQCQLADFARHGLVCRQLGVAPC